MHRGSKGKTWSGHLTFPDGETYVGEWMDGNQWTGTSYDKDGRVTATWLDGVRYPK